MQHFLPSSTHARRTCSTFFSGAAGRATTGASGADAAQPPWVLPCCATGGAPQPVLGGGAPQPPVLGGGAPQPPEASSGRERGGARSRLFDRERSRRRRDRGRERDRDRRRLRDLSSRELPPYAAALRSMSSLVVSHASHSSAVVARDAFRCAAIHKCSQLARKAQLYAGSAKVQSTAASGCKTLARQQVGSLFPTHAHARPSSTRQVRPAHHSLGPVSPWGRPGTQSSDKASSSTDALRGKTRRIDRITLRQSPLGTRRE